MNEKVKALLARYLPKVIGVSAGTGAIVFMPETVTGWVTALLGTAIAVFLPDVRLNTVEK